MVGGGINGSNPWLAREKKNIHNNPNV